MVKNLKWIFLFLLIILIIFIFLLSLTSNEYFYAIANNIYENVEEVSTTVFNTNYNTDEIKNKLILRKVFGHALPFFLLGIISILTIFLFNNSLSKSFIISSIIILIVSIISELLQLIPQGRISSLKDVFINFISSFTGQSFCSFIIYLIKEKK